MPSDCKQEEEEARRWVRTEEEKKVCVCVCVKSDDAETKAV